MARRAFRMASGSRQFFSTLPIEQLAKLVSPDGLDARGGGLPPFKCMERLSHGMHNRAVRRHNLNNPLSAHPAGTVERGISHGDAMLVRFGRASFVCSPMRSTLLVAWWCSCQMTGLGRGRATIRRWTLAARVNALIEGAERCEANKAMQHFSALAAALEGCSGGRGIASGYRQG